MTADLIDRLTAATGPDRELDAEIYCAVRGYKFRALEAGGILHDWPARGIRDSVVFEWPSYTGSLDAALTLVPDGMQWKAGFTGCALAWLYIPLGIGSSHDWIKFQADTVPLALCIAALRARAALAGKEE